MKEKSVNIKEGITLHVINNNKYKTNIISVFLSKKLDREHITEEALIPAVLRLGTNNIKTQRELNKKFEEIYGANFNCGVEKRGNNHVLKFYIETINDKYCLNNEQIMKESIDILLDIILNPLSQNEKFEKDYVECEKENLKRIIESRIDNKRNYSFTRCIEEMYKDEEYGLYEYGYIEDLNEINEENLYAYYKQFINECKIDIFISGEIGQEVNIENIIKENDKIMKLSERNPEYVKDSRIKRDAVNVNEITEKMDVAQGNIVIGMDIESNNKEAINIYNAILGGGANSKLFQNVREKASLAYTAGSLYLKTKNNIFIKCGIEIKNYDKAIEIIKQQLEDIKNGVFEEEDIVNAKELIIAGLKSIEDEQASEISYNMSQELTGENENIDDVIQKISDVNKQDVIDVANSLKIDTIYFLRN